MTVALVRYETARAALAECRRIDEVKDIRDKAEAMRAYGRMAKDVQLELDAAELRTRAEYRMGAMLRVEKTAGNLARGPRTEGQIKLSDIGIDKKLSARAQRLAAVPNDHFDRLLAEWRHRAAMDSKIRRHPLSDDFKILAKDRPYNFALAGGDIRHWSRGRLKRIIAALRRIDQHCGTASDATSVGEIISDAKLHRLAEGGE